VALSELPETLPLPVMPAVQAPYCPLKPPVPIVMVKVIEEPETAPVTVPLPVVPVLPSVRVTVPLKFVPDCVTCHATVPGPEESLALPDHEPPTFAVVVVPPPDGVVGVDDPPPPEQPAASVALKSAPTRTPVNRVKIMVETRRILARLSSIDWTQVDIDETL
jgi:hypothetical protein